MKGDSSGKDYEKPCATDTSVKKDHNVALIAAGRRDMGVRRRGGGAKVSCIRMRRILCKTREVSNNMRPLLHYKCLNFELLLIIGKYGSEHFPGRILALYVEYFLYLMYFKDSRAFHFFYKVFHHFACVVKINREILLHSAMDSTLFTHRIKLLLVFFYCSKFMHM